MGRIMLYGVCAETPSTYSDAKLRIVINRVWHLVTENGPWMMDKSKTPQHDCRSCRHLTLCRGVLDLSIIR
jgi:radical SAM protein with 4Fe4S-binding SPASM domain